MSDEERVRICYEALHDATCRDHGPHCDEFKAEIRDAVRVMLWRIDEHDSRQALR